MSIAQGLSILSMCVLSSQISAQPGFRFVPSLSIGRCRMLIPSTQLSQSASSTQLSHVINVKIIMGDLGASCPDLRRTWVRWLSRVRFLPGHRVVRCRQPVKRALS